MKIALFAIVAVVLTGCVSEKTALTNPQGQQLHCDHWGFGVIGAPAAMAMHSDCMKKAHAAGYSETPVPQTN
jgi:hypothetical protein